MNSMCRSGRSLACGVLSSLTTDASTLSTLKGRPATKKYFDMTKLLINGGSTVNNACVLYQIKIKLRQLMNHCTMPVLLGHL